MITINEPDDVFGLAVVNLLSPFFEEEKLQKKLKKWKKTIVVDLIDLYTFSLTFNNGDITVDYGGKDKYNLKLIIGFDTFMDIAEGQVGLIPAFIRGKVKVKKIYNIFTVLKFITILIPALKRATSKELPEGLYKVF